MQNHCNNKSTLIANRRVSLLQVILIK